MARKGLALAILTAFFLVVGCVVQDSPRPVTYKSLATMNKTYNTTMKSFADHLGVYVKTEMKRVILLKTYLVIIIMGLGLALTTALEASPGQDSMDKQVTRRMDSLKSLQKKLKECLAQKRDYRELLQLYGIKKVLGVAADYQNQDILLIGKLDDNSPPLHLEDLVLALRNIWDIYAQRQGNTIIYTPPGCSIDPSPEVLQRLQGLGRDNSTPQRMKRILQQWRAICSQPQKVRVDVPSL